MTDVIIETVAPVDVISTNTIATAQIAEVGIQGPAGRDGTTTNFIYNTPSANATWLIVHNLNRYPSVTVVVGGSVVNANVTYLDANVLQVDFAFANIGTAYLN
jgi:hypothetical protein